MSVHGTQDSSEDVNDFLRRIRALGEKNHEEDAGTRKLEDEILEGRRGREARRAERARSLSPEKQSPTGTPPSLRSHQKSRNGSPAVGHRSGTEEAATSRRPEEFHSSMSPSDPSAEHRSAPTSTLPARSGTLSWQQRPGSLHGPRSRPRSLAENRQSTTQTDESSADAVNHLSRDQISRSLGAKDPSWFRQTADRGAGNAALRKSEDIVSTKASGLGSSRFKLPGMGEVDSREDKSAVSDETSTIAGDSAPKGLEGHAPMPTGASQILTPPETDLASQNSENRLERRRSPERLSRSSSPTKGMGGFVQSAMLRKSDSVSKRWNAPSSREGAKGLSNPASMPTLRDNSPVASHNASNEAESRPQSSHSTSTVTAQDSEIEVKASANASRQSSTSTISTRKDSRVTVGSEEDISRTVTSSPSKRWSPQKSSWIESALAKPESPRPKHTPSQPAWMADLQKKRMSKDIGKDELPSWTAETEPSLSSPFGGAGARSSKVQTTKPETKPKPEILAEDLSKLDNSTTRNPEGDGGHKGAQSMPESRPKDKPATPPKKDFRSTLKSRSDSSSQKSSDALEFQAVFGKLKRTETKNYIAPDELKNNILRGKSGLAVTGGPKPSQRRDEFKESINKQKEAMKAKASEREDHELRPRPSSDTQNLAKLEALAKLEVLDASAGGANVLKPSSVGRNVESGRTEERTLGRSPQTNQPTSGQEADFPKSVNQSSGISSNKLANRFNPGLANIIARGPPSTSNESSSPERKAGPDNGSTTTVTRGHESEPESSKSLHHTTKARARGPKRRPPTNTATMESSVTSKPESATDLSPALAPTVSQAEAAEPRRNQALPTSSHKSSANSPTLRIENVGESPVVSSTKEHPKPRTPPKSSALSTQKAQVHDTPKDIEEAISKSAAAREKASTPIPVKKSGASWVKETPPQAQAKSPMKQPIKPSTQADEEKAKEDKRLLRNESTSVGLGLNVGTKPRPKSPLTPENSPRLPSPAKADENPSQTTHFRSLPSKPMGKLPGTPPQSQDRTPSSQTLDAQKLFRQFFDEAPIARTRLDIDSDAVSQGPQSKASGKIKTLRTQIDELDPVGKTYSLPSNESHILFDSCMYLVKHVFGNEKGSRITEVYLWQGNAVGPSHCDDAQVFARRAAKDCNGTLHIFRQGKEPATFFQALGGIVITRRGPSSAMNGAGGTSDGFMLCGRQHLGHIAFDEVEYSLSSFCSGFPFIIKPRRNLPLNPNGEPYDADRIYLWKGSGCTAEELGCARLISMDLGQSTVKGGEVVEVDDGAEPAEFVGLFTAEDENAKKMTATTQTKGKSMPRSADHWKLKAKHERYAARLFCVEEVAGGPSQFNSPVQEKRPPSSGGTTGNLLSGSPSLWSSIVNTARRASHSDITNPNEGDVGSSLTVASTSDGKHRVREISPFCQADLQAGAVYVLDAFFEIYITLGNSLNTQAATASNTRSHSHSIFASALLFAQEYGILAAGAQDRPFVPVGTVVLQGAPRDLRACFRCGWRTGDGETGTGQNANKAVGIDRGKSLRIVPLGAAVAAVKDGGN
ncbi:MAG: hypothetical protein M1831_001065 [Alyxoria varia]|nr:MAG: hypothetical protein M1831_001065 [Alyxoria varia]